MSNESTQPESKLNPVPRPLWLATSIGGQPVTLEIAEISGVPVDRKYLDENLIDDVIKPDTIVTIDRGIVAIQVADPRGVRVSVTDIRASLGTFYVPTDRDFSTPENRRPIYFKGSALFQGPYLWVDLNHPGEQELLDVAEKLYSKPSRIATPQSPELIAPGPGALQALGALQQ